MFTLVSRPSSIAHMPLMLMLIFALPVSLLTFKSRQNEKAFQYLRVLSVKANKNNRLIAYKNMFFQLSTTCSSCICGACFGF